MLAALVFSAVVMPLQDRWVYVQTNFFVKENVESTIALVHRAAKAGYNGIAFTDTKLQSLDTYPDFYRKSVGRFLDAAKAEHVKVIPMILPVGYADGMLAHNPNLVEAMPVTDSFVVTGGKAVVDGKNLYGNGGFESFDKDQFTGFAFQDGIGKSSFVDHQVVHGGASSVRIENPGSLADTSGNCRLMQRVKCEPWHQYDLSVWVKSEGFERASDIRAMALSPDGKSVSFGDVNVRPTQDWTRVHAVFNSQANHEMLVYLGVWGGRNGKLWFDDASLIDVGLLNVVRRPGCPIVVKGPDGTVCQEGTDYDRISDPKSGTVPWPGEFEVYHETPAITIPPGSRIRDGQKLSVSFYTAAMTESGKTAICPSEPAYAEVARKEIANVDELFRPPGFFLSHDEIRVMNWCAACQARKLTPGELLASNVRQAASFLPKGRDIYVWSDMFDPFHNAVKSYYLVNGDLTGSWKGLPANTVVVNWNSGNAPQSLGFFADHGFRQILAGYYDGPVDSIKTWLAVARGVKGVQGVMYTTWAGDFSKLEAFAKAAWGP